MKKLTKKDAMKSDQLLLDYHYQCLDKEYCVAWHRGTGMLIEEWCNYLTTYARSRGRDLFFATNEWGSPCCFFNATNEKEWKKYCKQHRVLQEGEEFARWAYPNEIKKKGKYLYEK